MGLLFAPNNIPWGLELTRDNGVLKIMKPSSTFGIFHTNYIICTNVEILNNIFLFFFSKEKKFVKEIKESFGIFYYLT
jgi:hypothetical protein